MYESLKTPTRGKKIERTCRCGVKFMARVADVKRGWAKFCSKSCKAKEQERRTGQHAAHLHQSMRAYYEGQYGGIACFDDKGRYVGFMDGNFSNEEHDCNKGD